MKRTLLILCLLISVSLLLPHVVHGQPTDLQFEHITTLDGLSQDIVTYLHRDRFGFLWIGTEDGLNQYDGYSIKVYKNDPNDTTSIVSNWISHICDYGDEDLLVTTSRGISVYHRASDSFTPLRNKESGRPLPSYKSPLQDPHGNFWVVTGLTSLAKCSADFEEIFTFDTRVFPNSPAVQRLFLDSKGRMLVGTQSALLIFEQNSSSPRIVRLTDPKQKSPALSVISIAEGQPGTLFIGSSSGLFRFDETHNKLDLIPLFKGEGAQAGRDIIHDLQWDHTGRLWVAGFGGLYCYYAKENRVVNFHNLEGKTFTQSNSRVYSILIDPAEILWVGTWNEGLFKKNLHNEQFGLLRISSNSPPGDDPSRISAIYEDVSGNLWLGGQDDGVTVIDYPTGARRRFQVAKGDPNSLSGSRITAITGDSLGNVWIASNYKKPLKNIHELTGKTI